MIGAAALSWFSDQLKKRPEVPIEVTNGAWPWMLVPSHVDVVAVPVPKQQRVQGTNEFGIPQEAASEPLGIALNKEFILNGVPYTAAIMLGWSARAELVVWKVV